MKKVKDKSARTNCVHYGCIKHPKCKLQVDSDNDIEAMVVLPECYQDKIKIDIRPPNFLQSK